MFYFNSYLLIINSRKCKYFNLMRFWQREPCNTLELALAKERERIENN